MNVNGNNYNITNNSLYHRYSAFSKSSGDKDKDIASDKSGESTDGVVYDKGSETSSKIYTSSGTLQGAKTDTSKSKYSSQEILSEINKYASEGEAYVIWHSGDTHWLQGTKNGEPDGGKKYFDLDGLQAALGKGNEKSVSVGNNAIIFDSNSYYKFTGKDGKEHIVLSLGGALSVGILQNSSYDKEAVDYVNFWNSLARENPSGIYMKFSNEEIRSRLAEAGIENGFFTVSIGGRTVTHYLSQGENASAVHSKAQYNDRYNMITSGRAFHHYEAGQKVMIGGQEYVLGEDKKVDIEYGADIFDIQMQASEGTESPGSKAKDADVGVVVEISNNSTASNKVSTVNDNVSFYGATVTKEQSEKLQDVITQLEEQGGDNIGQSWNLGAYAQLGMKSSQLAYVCKEMGLSDDVTDQIAGAYKAGAEEKMNTLNNLMNTVKKYAPVVMDKLYDLIKENDPEAYAEYKQRAASRGNQPSSLELNQEAGNALFDIFSNLDVSSKDNFRSSFEKALKGFEGCFLDGMSDVWKPQADELMKRFMNFL